MQTDLETANLLDRLRSGSLVVRTGRIVTVMPTYLEANGPNVPIGTICSIQCTRSTTLQAEVVGVDRQRVVLMPFGAVHGVIIGSQVTASPDAATAMVGERLLGRAVDAFGRPVDAGDPIPLPVQWELYGRQIRALQRDTRSDATETGIKAIDALMTVGVGQRVGVFAGSGVGKTTLLNSLAQSVRADIRIVCLVGERGREAADFWNSVIPGELKSSTIQIVSTSDDPAIVRVRAVHYAASIAEYFRDQGRHVVFLLDSLTRLAMALREIGLAAGEPPTVRAYTPSVFATLPRVIERFGAVRDSGAITAFFSVLTEGDDTDDPLAETVKALLDGHIILSRELAEQGHFPAINVLRSVSRFFPHVSSESHRELAAEIISHLATYESSRSVIESGLYKKGSNARLDRAIALREPLLAELRQKTNQTFSLQQALDSLGSITEREIHNG